MFQQNLYNSKLLNNATDKYFNGRLKPKPFFILTYIFFKSAHFESEMVAYLISLIA